MLLTALAAIIQIFVVLTWYAALFCIAIWLVAIAALRMMAKSDPLMRRVYLRHIFYKTSYRRPRRRGANSKGFEMVALKSFRHSGPSFADLVPYAGVLDGVILLNDGSLMAGWHFAGPDSESSTDAERNEVSRPINAILSRLGSGCMI